MTTALLEVRDLTIRATIAAGGSMTLLDAVSLSIAAGETVGVVGRSGAGKSTLGAALLRLLPQGQTIAAGSVLRFEGDDLLALDDAAMRRRRGRRMAMVFQEPMQALDPAMRVGEQLVESLVVHGLATRDEARRRARAMLQRVGIPDAEAAAERYPHEFSGGMRQRILIAAALLPGPALLVADEPTTALDTTIQAQVLDLIDDLRSETGSALLLISHDIDVLAERCARLLVLDGGRLVEDAPTAALMATPRSAAATELLAAHRRRVEPAAPTATSAPLLVADSVVVRHRDRRPRIAASGGIRAVDETSLTIGAGEAVGLVGESGCGKTSLAHALLRVIPAHGRVMFDGTDLLASRGESLRRLRRRLQLVPQDAGASLTPHLSVETLVAEGMEVHGIASGEEARRRTHAVLAEVGLDAALAPRLPHELSAGERQRVAIARALSTGPDLLICDEPVASVDAPTRELLLALLDRLRRERGLALLFISHDLASVARLASRVLVMYLGRLVEAGPASVVLSTPRMPYTAALVAAVPTGDPAARRDRRVLPGEPPSPADPPSGCPFHPRCPHPAKDAQCTHERPPLREIAGGHSVACWKA